jgi:hypothetical protein
MRAYVLLLAALFFGAALATASPGPLRLSLSPSAVPSLLPAAPRPSVHTVILLPFRLWHKKLARSIDRIHRCIGPHVASYAIVVAEQSDPLPFNKGLLLNVRITHRSRCAKARCTLLPAYRINEDSYCE